MAHALAGLGAAAGPFAGGNAAGLPGHGPALLMPIARGIMNIPGRAPSGSLAASGSRPSSITARMKTSTTMRKTTRAPTTWMMTSPARVPRPNPSPPRGWRNARRPGSSATQARPSPGASTAAGAEPGQWRISASVAGPPGQAPADQGHPHPVRRKALEENARMLEAALSDFGVKKGRISAGASRTGGHAL